MPQNNIIATKTSWEIHPIDSPKRIEIEIFFSEQQYDRLIRGFVPRAQEDKWFIYHEDGWLYFHRSWTGYGAYKAPLTKEDDGYFIREFWVERSEEKCHKTNDDADIADFAFLIARCLLGIDEKNLDYKPKVVNHHDAKTAWSLFGNMMFSPICDEEDKASQFERCEEAAAKGDAEAQCTLADCYLDGFIDVDNSKEEAVKWYQRSAEQGFAPAQLALGRCYISQIGVEFSISEAVKWLRKAAEQGLPEAQFLLGKIYLHTPTQNRREAAKWLQKAAEQDDEPAISELEQIGEISVTPKNPMKIDWKTPRDVLEKEVEADNPEAMLYLASHTAFGSNECVRDGFAAHLLYLRGAASADQGEPAALCCLAMCHFIGLGVDVDEPKAAQLLHQVAEQGYAPAQYHLAVCYQEGDGVTQNLAEAFKWYQKAAEQGDFMGQMNLGFFFRGGVHVDENQEESFKWFQKVAEQGFSPAQRELGLCYMAGLGVNKDEKEAVRWWRNAAEQGLDAAQYDLALAYFNGDGVEKNPEEAVQWLQKSCEAGNALAMYNLGLRLFHGFEVPQNQEQGYEYLLESAERGYEDAQDFIRQLHSAYEKEENDVDDIFQQ